MASRKKNSTDPADLPTDHRFGRVVHRCRKARGWTQEALAERSGLSADTIRRLEHGSFSPSLNTLSKLSAGLDLRLSTLFSAFELHELEPTQEIVDLLQMLEPREQTQLLRVLRTLQALLSEVADDADGEEDAA